MLFMHRPNDCQPHYTTDAKAKRRTKDSAEASEMGVSVPVELDPELLALLRDLLERGVLTTDEIKQLLAQHIVGDDTVSDPDAPAAMQYSQDRLRRNWMAQDRATADRIRKMQSCNERTRRH